MCVCLDETAITTTFMVVITVGAWCTWYTKISNTGCILCGAIFIDLAGGPLPHLYTIFICARFVAGAQMVRKYSSIEYQ